MRRFDRYRVADDDEVQAAYFNGVHEDVDLRLHAVEEKAVGWDEQVERFEDVALAKIDEALLPILEQALLTRERIERALISTGFEELSGMIEEDHGAEVTCRFCDKIYQFTEEDLSGLLRAATARDDEDE